MRKVVYQIGKIALTLYLYFISYFYTLSPPLSWTSPIRLLVFYLIVHYVCRWIANRGIQILPKAKKKSWKFGAGIFGIIAAILGIYYIAYYPGGLMIDTFNQWYQVDKGYLLDWHPAIHTWLFLKIPSLICDSLAFVNFLQIIWLGLAGAYFAMVLESWGIQKRILAGVFALAFLTPSASILLSFSWKDTALTIFVLILAGQIVEIVFSDGEWLRSWRHPLLFGLCGALAALMRHNAVLLVGPVMVLTVVCYWRQIRYYCLLGGLCTLFFAGLIKGPLYRVLEVQSHPQVSAEMLGVPMTILANVLIHNPDALEPECREFLYKIGDQEMWETNYQEGNWNSAKWMGDDISNDVIEEEGAANVLRYTWHAIKAEPYYSYRAVVQLFSVVWKPLGTPVEWKYNIFVQEDNGYGYQTTGVVWLQHILDAFRELSSDGPIFLTWGWYTGFYILLLLFAAVGRLGRGENKWLCWVPILCYNFGTALLLCGYDFRFFSFNIVVTFPMILAIIGKKSREEKQDEVFVCDTSL